MNRPGLRYINRLNRHSSIGDNYYSLEMEDIAGKRDTLHEYELERSAPHWRGHMNLLNKRDIKINQKDMNTCGYWDKKD